MWRSRSPAAEARTPSATGEEGGPGGATSPTAKAGAELTKTSEVPVGGGVILTDQKIVVTQPTEGTFKAFSAICTHQGFTVTSVEDDVINCNHHGSEYSAATGAVKRGPAQAALSEVAIKVSGTSVLAA